MTSFNQANSGIGQHPALDDCGCCEGLSIQTPVEIYNRPGLSAIAYRSGSHARFKATLLARLSGANAAALRDLNTRDDDDFTIALLDAWATVADVLTFYQERIANEAYLRTATERVSLLYLARLIGYELRPGVAANTALAFTCDEVQGVPPVRTTIPSGTKVQSVPEPGEKPQLFETVETIEARTEWNALKPRRARPHPISTSMNSITVPGLTTNLKVGDSVLIVAGSGASNRVVKRVLRIVPDAKTEATRIDLDSGTSPALPSDPTMLGQINQIGAQAPLTEALIQQQIVGKVWSQDDLTAIATTRRWSLDALVTGINKQTSLRPQATQVGVFALRQRAALFGHNAIFYNSLSANLRKGEWIVIRNTSGAITGAQFVEPTYPTSWENLTLAQDSPGQNQIFLDTLYPGIVKDQWLVLENPAGLREMYKVQNNVEVSRSAFAISAKVTRLTLDSANNFSQFQLRTTTVLAQSEQLELADIPDTAAVGSNNITLDRAYFGLKAGQLIAISGERADLKGVRANEVVTLDTVTLVGGYTRLTFTPALTFSYLRDTVTVNANVVGATHGETVSEVLGSGDAGKPYQRFVLRQPPLTYVSASTPSGAQSTLEIRVNDVRWHEVPTLYGHGPNEHIFITRIDDEGRTTVQFGDGITGARLPTGVENVRATYRKGIGAAGMVKAGQLSTLMSRPLGVRDVQNPVPAEDGADRESRDDARLNAPLTMLTLDRIVSLRDYEDFARAFIGVSKALATWASIGQRRGVLVTVAGTDGADIQSGSPLYNNLVAAMRKAGDPSIPLEVKPYRRALFKLAAAVKVDPDYEEAKVLQAVEQRLRQAFSFAARSFGQPVMLSEVIAIIQNVPGVVAVNVTKLYRSSPTSGPIGSTPPAHLVADLPQAGATTMVAAELLTLDPSPLTELGTMT